MIRATERRDSTHAALHCREAAMEHNATMCEETISAPRHLRIALVHNSPGGGAKRAVRLLAEGLLKNGHTIEVFVPSTAEEQYLPLRELGIPVHVFPIALRPRALNIRPFLLERVLEVAQLCWFASAHKRLARRMARAIDHGGYDVVWVDKCEAFGSPFVLRYLHTPTVFYCHDPRRDDEEWRLKPDEAKAAPSFAPRRWYAGLCAMTERWERRLRLHLDREHARCATRIVTNSLHTQSHLRRAYDRVALVSYLGIRSEVFAPLGLPREPLAVLVGRFSVLKRHHLAVRAIGQLPKAIRPRLVIVAEPCTNRIARSLRAQTERLAEQLDVQLEIVEGLSDQQLVELYNRAIVVLYTAVREPFGLVALEAMACGTPVVAVREGGLQESVIDGQTGVLVDPTPEACARAIERIAQDRRLQERLGAGGVEMVRRSWTWSAAVERFERHLADVANGRAASIEEPCSLTREQR